MANKPRKLAKVINDLSDYFELGKRGPALLRYVRLGTEVFGAFLEDGVTFTNIQTENAATAQDVPTYGQITPRTVLRVSSNPPVAPDPSFYGDSLTFQQGQVFYYDVFKDYFSYDSTLDTVTTNPDNIMSFAANPPLTGGFTRMLVPSFSWKTQPNWFIDQAGTFALGFDYNGGATQANPIQSWQELQRRMCGTGNTWTCQNTFGSLIEFSDFVVNFSSGYTNGFINLIFTAPGGGSLTFQLNESWFVASAGDYTVTATNVENRAGQTLATIKLDHNTVNGDTLLDYPHKQVIYVLQGAAAGSNVIIAKPITAITNGQKLRPFGSVLSPGPNRIFVQSLECLIPDQVFPFFKVKNLNLAMGDINNTTNTGSVVIRHVRFQSCQITGRAENTSTAEPNVILENCTFEGCYLVNCSISGRTTITGGAMDGVTFLPGAEVTTTNTILCDVQATQQLGVSAMLQMRPYSFFTVSDSMPILQQRNFSGVEMHFASRMSWETLAANGIFGTFPSVANGGIINLYPNSDLEYNDTVAVCAIAGNVIVARKSATTTWMSKATYASGVAGTWTALQTFAQLNAAPFSGWAEHPYTRAKISNGT